MTKSSVKRLQKKQAPADQLRWAMNHIASLEKRIEQLLGHIIANPALLALKHLAGQVPESPTDGTLGFENGQETQIDLAELLLGEIEKEISP